ncbi:unnamed protein product [Linum trigynum]|uniref:Uncharacterized protein n=1 Tax=Linum trigynum TaxID=586398 RepID=A0AAV2EVJ4_9ROSI
METFLWGVDEALWTVIIDGPITMDFSQRSTWNDAQKKSAQLNKRAMHIFHSAMAATEADKIEHCDTAHEI